MDEQRWEHTRRVLVDGDDIPVEQDGLLGCCQVAHIISHQQGRGKHGPCAHLQCCLVICDSLAGSTRPPQQ